MIWMSAYRPVVVTALLLWLVTSPARAQDAPGRCEPEPACQPPIAGAAAVPAKRPVSPELPGLLSPTEDSIVGDGAAQEPEHLLRQVRLDTTWLAHGGRRGLGVTDTELSATVAVGVVEELPPLLVTPAFATHFWTGPSSDQFPGRPDLPPQTYDASLDLGWRPQFARWLFADLGVTPGVYGDFHRLIGESFRPHGRALGIIAFSPQCQLVAGVLYVNRIHTQILPAGGVVWSPNELTRCELVFPQPKVSYRFVTLGLPQWTGFIMGEFGGGTWTVERASGATDLADYRDVRLLVGLARTGPAGFTGRLETGYVFDRALQYTSATPGLKPNNTFVLRAGFTF